MRRCLVALFAVGAISAPLLLAGGADAASSRVGVVVNHDVGDATTECVRIPGKSIRAIDLLTRTSFDMYTTGHPSFGRAICWLDGEGYGPGSSCFNGSPGASNWGLWLRKKGQTEPQPASLGASQLRVRAGGVLHAVFAEFEPPDFVQPTPDRVGLRSICGG